MPHHCTVPGCTSNSKTATGVSFHKFPADSALRRVWVRNIRRDERKGAWMINSSTRVCSLHFTEDSYCASGRKRERKTTRTSRILKVGAVPTVFDCFPKRLQPMSSKRKAPPIRKAVQPEQKECNPDMADGGEDASTVSVTSEDVDKDCVDTSADKQHDYCKCVETLQRDIAYLQSERIAEQANGRESVHMLVEEKARHDFCLDRFKSDDKKIRYYTGFVTYGMFEACFSFLFPSAKEMRTWQRKRTSTSERTTDKSGPSPSCLFKNNFSWLWFGCDWG